MAEQIFGVSALRVKIGKTFRISFKKLKMFKNRNPKKSAKIRKRQNLQKFEVLKQCLE